MKNVKKIGFWGYPDPEVVNRIKKQYPNSEWVDLDIDFGYPRVNILPESNCKIIRNIVDNVFYLKPDLIIAPKGKDKCDSGWFVSKILEKEGFDIVTTIYEKLEPKREIKICTSNLPLYDKVQLITAGIINPEIFEKYSILPPNPLPQGTGEVVTGLDAHLPLPGFWGVPPNDLEILKLFPDSTRVYGWLRCVEAGTPADLDLEMYVDENVPTVFYAQAFCAKSQLAKYLADKYNGLYIDIDDYASNSIKAKIEAFLRLR